MDRGLVLINTGPGKGKTTAALGTAVRALGQDCRVAFLQFIKNTDTGESRFLSDFAALHPDRLYYNRLGLGFLSKTPSHEERAKAAEALDEARRLMTGGYDLVVLDEICVAAGKGLIEAGAVADMLKNRPEAVSVILTGRGCPDELVELADTVTEMTEIKHAYQKGIKARRGIEF
jgi:cob(I)alamin adenosyltransferase